MAEERGVSLARVRGTGPGGRILKAVVEGAESLLVRAQPPRADEAVKVTPMRKTIARRLLASHQEIPTFFLTVSFDARGFVDLRTALKKHDPDSKVSYNDMLLACVARALREFPAANATWSDKEIIRYGRVDIGVAVALPEGLITPVIRGVDALTLAGIATQVRELAGRAKAGKLKPEEFSGGTFTVSNLGMFDISHFTAIINPPEAAILAVGSIAQVPVVTDGELSVGWRMNCTMTCDHRVIDGATGAQFLQILRKYVESPALLLM
jgi:pyruvate dehydrogenase E2 component (dihydrolipoamide acetyltransferase)